MYINKERRRAMIDCNKRYQTRDGFPVRILATDIKSRYCIAGVVQLGDDEYVRQWTADGKADYRRNVTTSYDLIEKGGQEDVRQL